jgi:hypothetical protein
VVPSYSPHLRGPKGVGFLLYTPPSPPADYSHNTPGIESGPGCGAVYGSNAPQGARSPERAAATLAPEPRFPSSAAMAATRGGARPALRGSSLSRLRGPLQVLYSFPAYRCGVRPLMHMSHDKYGLWRPDVPCWGCGCAALSQGCLEIHARFHDQRSDNQGLPPSAAASGKLIYMCPQEWEPSQTSW